MIFYTANSLEHRGLTGINSNSKTYTKWVYTKAVTAHIISKLKDMLYLSPETENPHHEASTAQAFQESEHICNLMAAVETNSFKVDSDHLLHILLQIM